MAEPKRRQLLAALVRGEQSVSGIIAVLGWPQPQVSKHLGVLLSVGLVSARRDGRQRMYRLNGAKLKAIHDWVSTFERFWQHQLDRIKIRAEKAASAKKENL